MKPVAVKKESIKISRNAVNEFLMMDRVPVYLEINALGLPYPARILIRPDY